MGHEVQMMVGGDAWDLVRDISLACAGQGSLRWVAYADGAQLEELMGAWCMASPRSQYWRRSRSINAP